MGKSKRSISSVGGSPANLSLSLGLDEAPLTSAGYGPSAGASSPSSIPSGASSKMSPGSEPEVSTVSFGTLPHSGAMRSGSISARPTWAHRTAEPVSSSSPIDEETCSIDSEPASSAPWPMLDGALSWPTANAGNFNDGEDPSTWLARRELHATKEGDAATRASLPLAVAAKLWTSNYRTTLTDAVLEWLDLTDPPWPTPMERDRRGAGSLGRASPTLEAAALARDAVSRRVRSIGRGGPDGSPTVYLSPSFVEALMGFPIGWTDLPRSETLLLKL